MNEQMMPGGGFNPSWRMNNNSNKNKNDHETAAAAAAAGIIIQESPDLTGAAAVVIENKATTTIRSSPRCHVSFQGEITAEPTTSTTITNKPPPAAGGFRRRYPRRNGSFHNDLLRPAVLCSIELAEGCSGEEVPPLFNKPTTTTTATTEDNKDQDQQDPVPLSSSRRNRSSYNNAKKRSRRVSTIFGDVADDGKAESDNGGDYSESATIKELTDSLQDLNYYERCSPPLSLRRRVSIPSSSGITRRGGGEGTTVATDSPNRY